MKVYIRTLCRHTLLCCIIFFGLHPVHLNAQQNIGRPEITSYNYQDYNAAPQNWWALEGDNGIMYFANTRGILEFDGVNWNLISAGESKSCRSLGKDSQGTIYSGGSGDFGFLEPNKNGKLVYVSLLAKIPEEHRSFTDVWEINTLGNKIYFTTNNKVYIWDGKTIEVVISEDLLHVTSVVNGKFYSRIWGRGLCELIDGEFKLVPGGEKFADTRIYQMLSYDKNSIMLGTISDGFFLFNGEDITPFETEVDDLVENVLYLPGVALSDEDGRFVINTNSSGAYLIDHNGHLLQKFNKETGLKNESVYYAYVDSRNILWLITYGWISTVDLQSPFTYLDSDTGIASDMVYKVQQHNGFLFALTNNGVYFRKNGQETFTHMEGTFGQASTFTVNKNRLYVSSLTMGLIEIEGESFEYVRKSENYDFRVSVLMPLEKKQDVMYAFLDGSIYVLNFDKNLDQFKEGSSLEITYSDATVDKDNHIWIATAEEGKILEIIPKEINGEIDLKESQIITYNSSNGLPQSQMTIFKPFDEIYFLNTENKSFIFDRKTNSFKVQAHPLSPWMGKDVQYIILKTNDAEDKVYANLGKGFFVAEKKGDSIHVNSETFKQLSNISISDVADQYAQSNGSQVIWFASVDGLIRYEGNLKNPEVPDFDLKIRQISTSNDSIIYAGGGNIPEQMKMDYDNNSISFGYAAPIYKGQQYVEYSTKLEGLESKWSDYTKQPKREYINLGPGNYTFKAKARSILGKTTEEVTFPFSINKPWYLMWWAYVLYALVFLGLIYFIVNRRTKMLRMRQKVLEENVQERTREVQQRLGELATINHISIALTEKLELNELIQMVGDEMKKLFNSDITYLALLDRDTETINFPYQDGDDIKPLKLGDGLTSKIIMSGEPLLINRDSDIVAEYNRMGVKESGKRAISYLGVPIPLENEIIGVLSVQSTQLESRFSEEDKRLLSTIAINVGVALHNAELFEQARQAKIRAEEANEAKSAFLSTVSHELRTPLTSVLGFAKIIRKRLEDKIFPVVPIGDQKIKRSMKQVSENLDVVVSEGERLTNLINDVLDLAKIESGRMEWNMKPVFLQDAINRAIASTQSLFDEKGISLKKNIQNDLPLVQADEDKLIQVVINLLSNAVKFTDKGKVCIEAYMEKVQIIVEVQDTGIGIADDDKHKIFEKFRQAGDTLTDKPKGTGLGLPICREIIEHHGGIIWMQSEPGVGSTFFFSIPVLGKGVTQQPIQLDRILKSLKKQIKHSTQKTNVISVPTILVVDDATPIRSLLRQELSEAGYKVKEASDGKSALDMVRTEKPDLIILDVMMPEINGFDVAAVLKNDPATMDIPIIILSIVQDKERGLRIGVDRYLTKPINTEELFHEVDVLLEQGVSKKKVLVVDEDSSAVKTLSEVLSARGYKVMESNTENFFETATEAQPDIIMLNSVYNGNHNMVKDLKLQKGMENVMFFIYE